MSRLQDNTDSTSNWLGVECSTVRRAIENTIDILGWVDRFYFWIVTTETRCWLGSIEGHNVYKIEICWIDFIFESGYERRDIIY